MATDEETDFIPFPKQGINLFREHLKMHNRTL